MKQSRALLAFVPIFLLFSSCSTQSWKDFFKDEGTEERNKELMESFGAEGEVFEKFSETKSPAREESKEDVLAKDALNEDQAKKERVERKVVQTPKKKYVIETRPKIPHKRSQIEKKSKSNNAKPKQKVFKFPEDYPDKLKKISKKSKKLWSLYKPLYFPGEKIFMDINYMGVSTGRIVLSTKEETSIGDQLVYHVQARLKTSDYYSYLYELDDSIDSYISKKSFFPVKFSLIQRESGQDIDDLQLFDHEKLKTYSFYKRVTEDKTTKKKTEKNIPRYFTDPLYVIWFLRGLPMEEGLNYEIPVMNRGKIIMLKTQSEGIENIETSLGEKRAYKVAASTTYSGDTLKSGDMTFWFSADDKKVFLKFNAKIKIGSISGEIEKYQP